MTKDARGSRVAWALTVLAAGGALLLSVRADAQDKAEGAAAPPVPPSQGAMKDAVKDAVKDTANVVLGAAGAAAAPAPAAQPAVPETRDARHAVLRKKVLRDEDFIESDDNRDPFRSFITLFVDKVPTRVKTVPAIFDKFALEELALIAIVSGTETPMAMFRDPGGLGQVIRRGDYLSKSAARVSKILGDRVILEMTEVMGTGESRALEKAVLVNPEGSQK